jgi:hypothetical protein
LDDEDEEDDDVRVIEEPMPKRARTGTPQSETVQSQRRETSNKSPVPEDPKNSKEVGQKIHWCAKVLHQDEGKNG